MYRQAGTYPSLLAHSPAGSWDQFPNRKLPRSHTADLTRSRAAPPACRGSAPPPRRTEARAKRTLDLTPSKYASCWCAGALFSSAPATRRAAPGGLPEAFGIFVQSRVMPLTVVTAQLLHGDRGVPMKITVDIDGFALKLLVAVGLAIWGDFGGGGALVLGSLSALLDT